jgi:hypothetical protein
VAPEVERAQRLVAELEAADTRRRRSETVQSALYRIAELASAAHDLEEFYRALHGVVGELRARGAGRDRDRRLRV